MVDGTYVHLFAAALFSLVFLFLWRQSGVTYFAYWSLAWAVESLAWVCTQLAAVTGWPHWVAFHSLFEFAFAVSLVAAARVALAGRGATPCGSCIFFPGSFSFWN